MRRRGLQPSHVSRWISNRRFGCIWYCRLSVTVDIYSTRATWAAPSSAEAHGFDICSGAADSKKKKRYDNSCTPICSYKKILSWLGALNKNIVGRWSCSCWTLCCLKWYQSRGEIWLILVLGLARAFYTGGPIHIFWKTRGLFYKETHGPSDAVVFFRMSY